MKHSSILKNIYFATIIITTTTLSLNAMILDQLNEIEIALVVQEVEKQGLKALQQTIKNIPATTPLSPTYETLRYTTACALIIEKTIDKSECKNNPLACTVFETIKRIEEKSGYQPKQKIENTPLASRCIAATNHLVTYTRYYWITENQHTSTNAVRIKSKFTNKQALLNTIQHIESQQSHHNSSCVITQPSDQNKTNITPLRSNQNTSNPFILQQNLNENLGLAIQKGNLAKVQQLISAGADPLVPSCEGGTTPLMKAAWEGHLPIVKYLIDLQVPINEIDSALGISPFHAAIQQGHYSIVEYLAYNGANLNLPNKDQRHPEIIAQQYGRITIKQFLTTLPIKLKNSDIITSAKNNNNAHVKSLLLKEDFLCINSQDCTGRTALAWATKNANYRLVKTLLNCGADKNIADRNDVTPLSIAIEMSDETLINLLLE